MFFSNLQRYYILFRNGNQIFLLNSLDVAYSLVDYINIFLFFFDKDIVSASIYTSHSSGSGLGCKVQNCLSLIRVCFYKIFYKCYWFLSRVEWIVISWWDMYCSIWVTVSIIILLYVFCSTSYRLRLCSLICFPIIPIRFSFYHLWIICWLFSVKNNNLLIASIWLLLHVHKICSNIFVGYPIILIHF